MKQGKTIVLLHGWGRGKNAWTAYHKTIEEFEKKGFTVFAPDMPGFGEASTPTHPLMLKDYSDFLATFIKKNNIISPVLIGHSFGGRVVIKYVTTGNTDAKAIILSGTPVYLPVKKAKWFLAMVISKIGGFIFTLPGLSNVADTVRGWFYYCIGARDFYRAQGAMRQTFKNVVGEQLKEYIKTIHIPTLLVWGADDIIVPVNIGLRVKQNIPRAKLAIIPNAGHSVVMDEPNIFVSTVVSFLQTI
jgi:pimeloyl-ACP methyl ester carboxylesterase